MLNRILVVLFLLVFLLGGYVAYTAVTLPNVRLALENGVEPSQTSMILARDKSLIMSYGKFQHKPIPMDAMPHALIDALVSTEDRRFYQHHGVDPIGIVRALVQNVRSHGVHEGGSTLTQQLARNIFLSNERSLQRKVKEALLAVKLEQQLTKDQILELYLNNVYFGEGAYGVGAASEIYFGKTPKALSKAECALLAGLPQAPSLYSPFANPNLAIKRRNEVLENLVETHKMTHGEANRLKNRRLHLNPNGRSLSSYDKAPFFSRYVIQEALKQMDMDEQTFWQQGVKVYTTLDPRAQRIAQGQVLNLSNAFGRTRRNQQAALLSINSQGGIIAYVGGKNFSVSQFDRVSQARRPAGSLFKIFVYTTAIERGVSPLTVYKDAPVVFGDWKPENYDKSHHGYMTLAKALALSNNIIAVKLLKDMTPDAVIQTARKMGIQSTLQPNLSLALGAADVSLQEMTTAFSVFSNKGDLVASYAIDKIVDRNGHILYQHSPQRRNVLQRVPRDTMVELMQGVVKFGTAKGAALGRDAAGKTGTSDDYHDAWFIGYTPEVTTGVWVGNDDNSRMPGITGGSLPARIWRAYMSHLLAGMPKREFDLSYALPVEEKDFFVYNLDNLSATEGKPTESEASSTDTPSDTPDNAEGETNAEQDTYSFVDGQMQKDGNTTEPTLVNPSGPSPGGAAGNGGVEIPPTNRPLMGDDRYYDSTSPSSSRFAPSPSGTKPKLPRYYNNSPSGAGSRPIVDPMDNTRSGPRTLPQKPDGNAALPNN